MSGGHFNHEEYKLEYIADAVEDASLEASEDTILPNVMRNLAQDIRNMRQVIRALDLYLSGDTEPNGFLREYKKFQENIYARKHLYR